MVSVQTMSIFENASNRATILGHRFLGALSLKKRLLLTGGIPVGRIGYPLHCRLRYFDLQARRAGLPPHLAALVEAMDADSVTVQLVNTSSTLEQTVVLQGGAYGEHSLTGVTTTNINGGISLASVGAPTPITDDDGLSSSAFAVTIQPGCAGRLKIGPYSECPRSSRVSVSPRLHCFTVVVFYLHSFLP